MKKQNHTSHIAPHTSQKGITLIALIITIIVMLILVGVTINVALNGGLFKKAEQATRETEEKAILEEMLAMMDITDEGKINAQAIIDKMKEKYTVEGNIPNITITGKLGKYNYIVSETEIKIGESDNPQIDEVLKRYILGASGTGRPLIEIDQEGNIIGGIFNGTEFLDDPETEDIDETELGIEILISGMNENETKSFAYVKYNNKAYKITVDETIKSEKLEFVYEPKGKEGQITADGWTILYDNGETVEAVSPTGMGLLRLGHSENATTEEEKTSEAIESYNSAIKTINDYCKELKNLPENSGVRSAGASAETSDNESNKYTSTNLELVKSNYNGIGKKGDVLYEQDFVRMAYHGVLSTGKKYWMASRHTYETSDVVYFRVWIIDENGNLDTYGDIWDIEIADDSASGYNQSEEVRPIITIKSI